MKCPDRLKARPVAKGYPVPWFVQSVNGVPDFRLMDREKFALALRFKKCWICGEGLGRAVTFASGPIAGITRVSPEPPAHHECAEFAATTCPHMTLPKAKRRPVPESVLPGHHFPENPGVWLLWTTNAYAPLSSGFIRMGEPTRIEWFCEGRAATAEEVEDGIAAVEPSLRDLATKDGLTSYFDNALAWLRGQVDRRVVTCS